MSPGRTRSGRTWLERQQQDPWVRRARAEGFRARSAYKLAELDAAHKLFRPAMLVVDLGAAPGGWTQYAVRHTKGGHIIAVDLLSIDPIAGAEAIRGDFTDESTLAAVDAKLAGRPVDLVISDMAPNITGVATTDSAQSLRLAEAAFVFARTRLAVGGALVIKLFESGDTSAFVRAVAAHFRRSARRKPKSSRTTSIESYLVAEGFKPMRDG